MADDGAQAGPSSNAAAAAQALAIPRSAHGIVPQLQNTVATVNLDTRLDLKSIALHSRNSEYNPKVKKVETRKGERENGISLCLFASLRPCSPRSVASFLVFSRLASSSKALDATRSGPQGRDQGERASSERGMRRSRVPPSSLSLICRRLIFPHFPPLRSPLFSLLSFLLTSASPPSSCESETRRRRH